jgi:hypothetical protein
VASNFPSALNADVATSLPVPVGRVIGPPGTVSEAEIVGRGLPEVVARTLGLLSALGLLTVPG